MPRLSESRLAEMRARRDATRDTLIAHARRVRGELSPERLGERVVADLGYRAREAAIQAIEIAGDNRGILAATASAAGLWLARRQALSAARGFGATLWRKWGEIRAKAGNLATTSGVDPGEAAPAEPQNHGQTTPDQR